MYQNLEIKIKKRIHEFDPISLVRILEYMGYSQEDIRFKSNFSSASQKALIEDIEYYKSPEKQVIIIFNFGLLSAQSLLPSYFFKQVDSNNIDPQAFIDFIGFFDHHLIRNYLLNLYPEINKSLISDWEQTKSRYLRMLDFKSCSTLHFLFQLVFPELEVNAEKRILKRLLETTFPRLGSSRLGDDAVFGKEITIPVPGVCVTLTAEDELTYTGQPWAKETGLRLDSLVFPLLRQVGIDIEIILVIRSQKSWAKLHEGSYLGYDKIRGGDLQYRRIKIFRGHLTGNTKCLAKP